MKRILVTGATGFLGRNVLAALQASDGVEPIAACRTPSNLGFDFPGEVRSGDLRDPDYRRTVVKDVDVVCHTGSWASMWGHAGQERSQFFEPACDLAEQAIRAGADRFLVASTVVIGTPTADGSPIDDLSPTRTTGFWPHLDRLVELDAFMRENCHRGTRMITMRLGHFVGAGNVMGLVPALAPRLRTRLVPWIAGGRSRLPLVADTDLGEAFARAAVADGLDDFESFNICGPDFPTTREVIDFIAAETAFPTPWYSVPRPAAHAFGWLMERLHPVLPGSSPFLTRSLVHLAGDWPCATERAAQKLGYVPRKDWRTAARWRAATARPATPAATPRSSATRLPDSEESPACGAGRRPRTSRDWFGCRVTGQVRLTGMARSEAPGASVTSRVSDQSPVGSCPRAAS